MKYYFMPSRWRSYAIYLLRQLLLKVDGSEWTPQVHEIEQYMFRYLTCEDCMEAGTCQHNDCKCKMPERAHIRTDHCPTTKWGPFQDKKGWNNYKSNCGIQFAMFKKEWSLVTFLRHTYPEVDEVSICSKHITPVDGCELCHLKLKI